ncbi:MAG: hypothetical protein ACP5E5_07580 [Acidobacteriaceae bacterium]
MAELETPSPPSSQAPAAAWTPAQTWAQFAAIAWLRWRITVNSLSRRGGAGELAGRAVTTLIFLAVLILWLGGAGLGGFLFVSHGHINRIAWLLWGIFLLCQILNIQFGQRATNFDPTQLIRFPMQARTYVEIRLFFGMLTAANVTGTLMAVAVAVGITLAAPTLSLYAVLAMAAFATANLLFSRMIFAWVDRWLSTRRAREVVTALLLAFSLLAQWANFTFNPAYNHRHGTHVYQLSQKHQAWVNQLLQNSGSALAILPPHLAAASLTAAQHGDPLRFTADTLAVSAYAALFLLVFALRMLKEFRGETLSEPAAGVRNPRTDPARLSPASTAVSTQTALWPAEPAAPASAPVKPTASMPASTAASHSRLLQVAVPVLSKEILYSRRNMGILYGLLMPLFLVLVFAGRFASLENSNLWAFPAAVGYSLLVICPLSYNIFGLDGPGVQLFFLAPVRLRDVVLAKNMLSVVMAILEIILIFFLITAMAGAPSRNITLATLFWAAGTLALNLIFGNRRSFYSPKRMDPQRVARKQTSPLSALISLAFLVLCAGVAVLLYGLCLSLHALWALSPVMALLAAISVAAYAQSLRSMDGYALQHREELMQEICKVA